MFKRRGNNSDVGRLLSTIAMMDDPDGAPPFRVACIVLAAGAGTRFGEPKAGAIVRPGVRFVDAVVETARLAGAEPIIVVGSPGLSLPPGAVGVTNANARGEQIQSLRLGLARLVSVAVAGALVWPVDHPYVDGESVSAIIAGARRTGAPVVLPVFEGRRGHPVYFSRDCWRELATVAEGGARTVVHAYAAEILEVSVINIGVVRDIDSRADMTNGQGARGNAVS
jgi:CTP:molybdopterin cytidylyltransferase MocA